MVPARNLTIEMHTIAEFPAYSITRDGRVYSHEKQCFVKIEVNHYGYLRVRLRTGNKRVYRNIAKLVALTYLPPPTNPNAIVVIKNGILHDIRVSNIAWKEPVRKPRLPVTVRIGGRDIATETIERIHGLLEDDTPVGTICYHLGITPRRYDHIVTSPQYRHIVDILTDKDGMDRNRTDLFTVTKICELLEAKCPIEHIQVRTKVSRRVIVSIARGVSWKHISKRYKIQHPYRESDRISLGYMGYPEYHMDVNGVVYGRRGKPLVPGIGYDGYLRVGMLDHRGIRVKFILHQLIATNFKYNPGNYKSIEFKDNDLTNTHPSNLKWVNYDTPQRALIDKSMTQRYNHLFIKRVIKCTNNGLTMDGSIGHLCITEDVYQLIMEDQEYQAMLKLFPDLK